MKFFCVAAMVHVVEMDWAAIGGVDALSMVTMVMGWTVVVVCGDGAPELVTVRTERGGVALVWL